MKMESATQVLTSVNRPAGSNQKISVSVLVAVLNAADTVEKLVSDLADSLSQYGEPFEIIFVDDGSEDTTPQILRRLAEEKEAVKFIRMRSTFGEASALDAGLKLAKGEKIVYLTSRVRINPRQISKLLEPLREECDLVVGWRYPRRDSKWNQLISRLFNLIINRASRLHLHDINSGVLAAKREVFENISVYGDLNNFIPVLAVKQGYRVTEVQIEQMAGWFRTSRYVTEYIRRFLDIITVIFLTRYSKKPIHFLGFVGALFTLIGAAINIYLFFYRIFQFGPIAGKPMLVLGALLLVIGIQMVSIGLIGEMIIFTHAKEVKEYNIEEIVGREIE